MGEERSSARRIPRPPPGQGQRPENPGPGAEGRGNDVEGYSTIELPGPIAEEKLATLKAAMQLVD